MTKPNTTLIALALATAAFSACGEDPYSGDSASPDANTNTKVDTATTDTKTTTGVDTSTATTSQTSPATDTKTSLSTDTKTSTTDHTSPGTVTTTQIVTVTVTNTSTVDGGVVDAPPTDPGYLDIYVTLASARLLDLVFMVDNSPSMAPKVAKLNAQFPKLMAGLRDPADGTLPDLRVAVIDSDLGTGGAYTNNSCAVKTLSDGTQSMFGDLGRFQMLKAPQNCTFNDGAQFLEYKSGQPLNYTGDINSVFACLASNLGTMGCGMESQLQAFEFALAAQGVGNEQQQKAFLRSNAQLGLVFLSDEDDCSAAPNDRLYGDLQDLRGESASLRCATRAHMCNGQNLTSGAPGYPTTASFTAPLAACQPRMDDECAGDVDTSKPTTCNPLKSVKTMAAEIKALKSDPDQVFVAGIFGWPLANADMASAEYKIAPMPNPNTADIQHPTVYSSWPVCYDPDHLPTKPDSATGYDIEAAGWGAAPGLREAAFVEEFGDNGMKFSICERDYSGAMNMIGGRVAKKLQNLCVDYKLLDSDLTTAGVQPECRVFLQTPMVDGLGSVTYKENASALPMCAAGATNGNVPADCWQMVVDNVKCPTSGQLVQVLRTQQELKTEPQFVPGTRVRMNCHVCGVDAPETGCHY